MREQPIQLPPRSRPAPGPIPSMPVDKQTKSNTSKPLTPALSSNFRNVRSPLTPRLVGSASSSPVLPARREPFVRSRSPAKQDQVTTPLNGNITPRSGARGVQRSRFGTESPTTPAPSKGVNSGTPSRGSFGNEAPKPNSGPIQGLGIASPRLAASTSALAKVGGTSTPVLGVQRRTSAAKSMIDGERDISTKFFHADEAKVPSGQPGFDEDLRSPRLHGQFLSGSPPVPVANSSHPRGNDTRTGDDRDDKFFRINDIPQHAPPKHPPVPHIPTQKIVGPLNTAPGQLPALSTRPNGAISPQSPRKDAMPHLNEPVSPRKFQLGGIPSPPAPRTTLERPKSSTAAPTATHAPTQTHRKSISASSITSTPPKRPSAPLALPPQQIDLRRGPGDSPHLAGNSMLSPDTLSPRSTSLASTNTVPTSVTSDIDFSEITRAAAGEVPPSDAKGEPTSPHQPQQDHAANARRERKVLDLEISNSSLLAINKTLERELRKQSSELRRYRRLSRSGRLSIATSARSVSGQTASSLGTLAELDGEDEQFSELDEDSDLDDLDDEDDSLLSNDSGAATDPSARSRQRERDEKRLMQDLTRHHQLLLDSQKLSQSIKRCLTCTEELIRDGNKALEYRVGIGDVQLGGRVLNDDELDEQGLVNGTEEREARQGLLSPSLAKSSQPDFHIEEISSHPPVTTDSTALASLEELTQMLESVSAGLEKP